MWLVCCSPTERYSPANHSHGEDVKLCLKFSLLFFQACLMPYLPAWNIQISHNKSRLLTTFKLLSYICVNGLHSDDTKLRFYFQLFNKRDGSMRKYLLNQYHCVCTWGLMGSASLMALQQEMITVITPRLEMPAYSTWDHLLTSTAAKP